jgi:hypothetical protein
MTLTYPSNSTYFRHVWQYDRGNYATLNETYNSILWHVAIDTMEDVNECTEFVTDFILRSAKEHIPNRTVKIRPQDCPGMNNTIRKLLRQVHRLHKRKQRTSNPEHILAFKNKRREAHTAIKESKKEYYRKQSEKLLDPNTHSKTYWKIIRSVYGSKQECSIPSLKENGTYISNNTEKANILNDYFVKQTEIEDTGIPLPPLSYTTDGRINNIIITPTIVKEVLLP